jgi:hypothetical protein
MSTKHKSQFNQQLVTTIHKHSNAPTMLIQWQQRVACRTGGPAGRHQHSNTS